LESAEEPTEQAVAQLQPSITQRVLSPLHSFLWELRSIRLCASEVIPQAQQLQTQARQAARDEFEAAMTAIRAAEEDQKASTIIRFQNASRIYMLHHSTGHDALLHESLFMHAFSRFEAFLGRYLRRLYEVTPKTHGSIKNTIGMESLMQCASKDEAISLMIDREVESLLRDGSYADTFGDLAKRFGIDSMTKFANWGVFIECAERRNLITHCEGRISGQYLAKCHAAGHASGNALGTKLTVDATYLHHALNILYEVSFGIAHTLLRKIWPDEVDDSDQQILNGVVEILRQEEWSLAETLAEFGVNAKPKSNDKNRRLKLINFAQAVRWRGDLPRMKTLLSKEDWSSSIRDIRLAVAILNDEYDEAAELMTDIGKNGEIMNETAYLSWPIFREFRTTEQFLQAFESIYKRSFADAAAAQGTLALDEQLSKDNSSSDESCGDPQ
jgi:hypothetical protein